MGIGCICPSHSIGSRWVLQIRAVRGHLLQLPPADFLQLLIYDLSTNGGHPVANSYNVGLETFPWLPQMTAWHWRITSDSWELTFAVIAQRKKPKLLALKSIWGESQYQKFETECLCCHTRFHYRLDASTRSLLFVNVTISWYKSAPSVMTFYMICIIDSVINMNCELMIWISGIMDVFVTLQSWLSGHASL